MRMPLMRPTVVSVLQLQRSAPCTGSIRGEKKKKPEHNSAASVHGQVSSSVLRVLANLDELFTENRLR